jgi:hypothetical protein
MLMLILKIFLGRVVGNFNAAGSGRGANHAHASYPKPRGLLRNTQRDCIPSGELAALLAGQEVAPPIARSHCRAAFTGERAGLAPRFPRNRTIQPLRQTFRRLRKPSHAVRR